MKHRWSMIVLAVLLAFSLAACGTGTAADSAVENIDDADTPLASPEAVAAQSGGSGVRTLAYSVTEEYQTQWDDHYNMQTVDCRYDQIRLGDKERKALNGLNSALSAYNQQVKQESEQEFLRLQKEFEDFLTENGRPDVMYTMTNELRMVRGDEHAVSILRTQEEYIGGPHGSRTYSAVQFDAQTGEKLKLEDVLTDTDRFQELVTEDLRAQYPDLEEEQLQRYAASEMVWSLGYQGIDVYYSPGSLGAYALGTLHTQVLFSQYPDLFRATYQEVPAEYTVPMSISDEFYYDLTGTGEVDSIQVYGSGYQGDYYQKVIAQCNQETAGTEVYAYDIRPLFLHTGDGNYLYAVTTSDNDYQCLFVYDLKDGEVLETGSLGATGYHVGEDYFSTYPPTDPSSFTLDTRIYALGTYDCIRTYHAGKGGVPEAEEQTYTFSYDHELTVKKDMEFMMLSENGEETERTVVPKGSKLQLLRTDGRTYVDCQVTNSVTYPIRIYYDDSDWPITIEGEDADQVLDGMVFAG